MAKLLLKKKNQTNPTSEKMGQVDKKMGKVMFDTTYRGLRLPWWLRQYRVHPQCRRPGFSPWVGKIPWRAGQPTPVFLLGESVWTEEPGRL